MQCSILLNISTTRLLTLFALLLRLLVSGRCQTITESSLSFHDTSSSVIDLQFDS